MERLAKRTLHSLFLQVTETFIHGEEKLKYRIGWLGNIFWTCPGCYPAFGCNFWDRLYLTPATKSLGRSGYTKLVDDWIAGQICHPVCLRDNSPIYNETTKSSAVLFARRLTGVCVYTHWQRRPLLGVLILPAGCQGNIWSIVQPHRKILLFCLVNEGT